MKAKDRKKLEASLSDQERPILKIYRSLLPHPETKQLRHPILAKYGDEELTATFTNETFLIMDCLYEKDIRGIELEPETNALLVQAIQGHTEALERYQKQIEEIPSSQVPDPTLKETDQITKGSDTETDESTSPAVNTREAALTSSIDPAEVNSEDDKSPVHYDESKIKVGTSYPPREEQEQTREAQSTARDSKYFAKEADYTAVESSQTSRWDPTSTEGALKGGRHAAQTNASGPAHSTEDVPFPR